ncbi:MAG: RIP metalloprotease RseP [Bacilli bacterium]
MTFIYFILVLSITIFVHELGHFIFAKKAGIYVYEFCIGMGPRIFKFKRKNDETEYGIRLFPIGGFCSMAGEAVEVDEKVPVERRMQSKTWLQKFLTVIAGVMFNFIFAIIILFIVGLVNGKPNNKPIISTLEANSPAFIAGLKPNSFVKELNGVKVKTIDRLLIEYQVNYGKEITLLVVNNGQEETIKIKPNVISKDNYLYGFSLDNSIEKGLLPAFEYAFTKFGSLINQMVIIIAYLFTGRLSLTNLSGPIGIFNIVGQSAKAGFINIVYLIGYLSINVGFINLLPIPAFDGGRILFLIIEKIRRKPISSKVENTIHSIGFILLMLLMVVITYNDIVRFIIK